MSFDMKTWGNPISLDANNLNRIEQGIKNAHDTLDITNGEVSNLQINQTKIIEELNTLTSSAPSILKTLTQIETLLTNNDISTILNSSESFLLKGSQTLTAEELTQVYKNLKLDSFLKLTNIKVNNKSVVHGSEVNIPLDSSLDINSDNAISNRAVASALKNINLSGKIPTKLSDLKQDDSYMTVSKAEKDLWNSPGIISESDPTVPDWAKTPNKPKYTYAEIIDAPTVYDDNQYLKNGAGYTTETRATDIATTVFNTNITTFETTKVTPFNNRISIIEGQLPVLSELLNNHNHDTLYSKLNHTHQDLKDYTDNAISTNLSSYLLKSGGTMTGQLKFADNTALPNVNKLDYIVGLAAYADGGNLQYTTKAQFKSQLLETNGAVIKGRVYGSGDDEGVVVGFADNGYAGVILGSTDARRSCLYLSGGATGTNLPEWRYTDPSGTTSRLYHPHKTGTIACVEDCLPVTGGTLNGAILFPDTATYSTTSQPTALSYGRLQAYGTLNINGNTDNSGTEYVNITAGHGCSSSTADGLSIGTDTLTWKNQDVIHTGNLSSKLADSITAAYNTYTLIDATSLDINTWYPVTMAIARKRMKCLVFVQWTGGTPTWSSHGSDNFSTCVEWEATGSNWGEAAIARNIHTVTSDFADQPVRGIDQLNYTGIEYVYVRGGAKYHFYTNWGIVPVLRTSTLSSAGQSVSPTTSAPSTITPTRSQDTIFSGKVTISGSIIV